MPFSTVVIISCNGNINDIGPDFSLVRSKLSYLNNPFPVPRIKKTVHMNGLFIDALKLFTLQDIALAAHNPMLYILPHAQLCSISVSFDSLAPSWDPNNPADIKRNTLGVNYLRCNFQGLQEFFSRYPTSAMSERVLRELKQGLDHQSNRIQLHVPYINVIAANTSLEESRRSVELSESVKHLTQLAFAFVPLTFVTSVFGMNLNWLGSGNAKAWMVIVAIPVAYGLGYAILTLYQLWVAIRSKIFTIPNFVKYTFWNFIEAIKSTFQHISRSPASVSKPNSVAN
jgi:hypothetical protein